MDDGSVLLVEIARRTLSRVTPDGRVHVAAELGAGSNDIAIDAPGGFYLTDLGKLRETEMDRAGLFHGQADGSVVSVITRPVPGLKLNHEP